MHPVEVQMMTKILRNVETNLDSHMDDQKGSTYLYTVLVQLEM